MFPSLRRSLISTTLCTLFAVAQGRAQRTDLYPQMAPLAQYLIADRNAEIELARSAAPPTLSASATILTLGPKGFETAVTGSNGFVCLVTRSFGKPTNQPDFWNPRIRGPICLNAAAAKSVLPHIVKKTEWALAGLTKEQIIAKLKLAVRNGAWPAPLPSSMGYALSKSAYVDDVWQRWHPHLTIFSSSTAAAWGAEVPGTPVIAVEDPTEHMTAFAVAVTRWSDGSLAPALER